MVKFFCWIGICRWLENNICLLSSEGHCQFDTISEQVLSTKHKQGARMKVQTVFSSVVFSPMRISHHLLWAYLMITSNNDNNLPNGPDFHLYGTYQATPSWSASKALSSGTITLSFLLTSELTMVNWNFTCLVGILIEIRVDFSTLPTNLYQLWNSRKHRVALPVPLQLLFSGKASITES